MIPSFPLARAAYRLYTVVPRLVKFVDNLTNWYVRFNRKRLKGANGVEDCTPAIQTLGEVLVTMSKMMAPLTPFYSGARGPAKITNG